MKFEEYNVFNKDGKSNCVIRSFCKLYNEEYDNVYNELCDIANKYNGSFNDISVFEKYMLLRNTIPIEYGKDILVKDLKLDNGKYIVFCYDKKEWYHMVCIIDNILYDKDNSSLDLYSIKLYKKQ